MDAAVKLHSKTFESSTCHCDTIDDRRIFLVQHHSVYRRTTIIFLVTTAMLLQVRFCRILRSCCCRQDRVIFSRDGIPQSHLNEAVQDDPSQACARGLHSSIVRSLPIAPFKIRNEEDLRPSKEECSVCLGEFKKGELLKHLPKCTHSFHFACIDSWFQGHSNCPLCRTEVYDSSDHECSISVNTLGESLSEDFFRERAEHYAILRTRVLQNLEISPHEPL